MEVEKQSERFPLSNFDLSTLTKSVDQQIQHRHGKLFPNTIRCLITGPSNSGKTNVMLSMLMRKN